jgi:drug/metabolite transporter (DMT)-like permease
VPIVLATVGARRALTELRAAAWPLAVVGLTNSAIPILSITWAETRIDSGLTAIIQASAPLFTALLAIRFSQDQRVRGSRLAGLVVGFAGVAMLVGGKPSGELVAGLAVVFSAFCYAAAGIYAGRRLKGVAPLVIAFGTLTVAALATLPAGLFQLPDHVTGWKVTASMLTLGIAGTGIAYILYYGLIAGAGASRAILITYLVPMFAVVYGAVLLAEPVTAATVGGLALVLAGVALGTGALAVSRRAKADQRPSALGAGAPDSRF